MTKWDDNDFSDADDPADVAYMLVKWYITECKTCISGLGYKTHSRQFEHLPKGTNRGQAQAIMQQYTDQHRARHNQSRKLFSIFLLEVVSEEHIQDDTGQPI